VSSFGSANRNPLINNATITIMVAQVVNRIPGTRLTRFSFHPVVISTGYDIKLIYSHA
jgi:hypothetical protein